jgi:hypothetical protein
MKTTAIIEKGKDGTVGIYTPNINHTIVGEGNTIVEAKADFENSLQEIILSYTELDQEVPNELRDIEFEYRFGPQPRCTNRHFSPYAKSPASPKPGTIKDLTVSSSSMSGAAIYSN